MRTLILLRRAITEALGVDAVIRAGGGQNAKISKCQNNNIVIRGVIRY